VISVVLKGGYLQKKEGNLYGKVQVPSRPVQINRNDCGLSGASP